MTLYRYRATDSEGVISKGRLEAIHETDLTAQLDRLGLVLVSAKQVDERIRPVKKLPPKEIIAFLFQLEMMIRAGVPILTALGDMVSTAESRERQVFVAGLFENVEKGATLSQAMANYPGIFSEITINLIRSGEVTGQLPEVLKEVVRSLKWQDEIKAMTKKMLTYPAFTLVVIIGVIAFMMIYLVPQLVAFLKNMGQALPLQTRVLIWVSNLFVHYWWALIGGPVLLAFSISTLARIYPRVRFALHQVQLKLPIIGEVLQKVYIARLADTFALMYRTGIPVHDGLVYCKQVAGNLVIQQAIERVIERVTSGMMISESFATEKVFPIMVIRMLQVGESSGELDTALENVSYFYTREINESIGKVQSLIEPVMTVSMGLLLAWILLSVITPVYDTIGKMKS